jgi:hypothetical protein
VEQNKQPSSIAPSGRVYRITEEAISRHQLGLYLFVFFMGFLGPLLAFLISWSNDRRFVAGDFIVVGAMLLFVVRVLVGTRRWNSESLIEVRPDELIYHRPGLTIRTPWDNIERIEGNEEAAQLILRERSAASMSFWTRISRFRHSSHWNVDRQVPLWPFGWSRKSPLYHEIQEIAPHLFLTVSRQG